MLAAHFIFALAPVAPSITHGKAPPRIDDLEPSIGILGGWGSHPYESAVRNALIDPDRGVDCRMLVIPSNSEEWCVCLRRDKGAPPELEVRRVVHSIWNSVMHILYGDGSKTVILEGPDEWQAALAQVQVQVQTSSTSIDSETADLIELAWWKMLGRARYPEEPDLGCDGETYYFMQWNRGLFRTGEVWSPEEGTRTRALVDLGEHMRDLVSAPARDRARQELVLRTEGQALLACIEKQATEERGN